MRATGHQIPFSKNKIFFKNKRNYSNSNEFYFRCYVGLLQSMLERPIINAAHSILSPPHISHVILSIIIRATLRPVWTAWSAAALTSAAPSSRRRRRQTHRWLSLSLSLPASAPPPPPPPRRHGLPTPSDLLRRPPALHGTIPTPERGPSSARIIRLDWVCLGFRNCYCNRCRSDRFPGFLRSWIRLVCLLAWSQ